mmetsp:Transcript_7650/g.18733  ORF Transcript_7650/g.18733 Transcript_7650/m.18733 type:complete len:95 (+) Transcript_7650:705-989(+)
MPSAASAFEDTSSRRGDSLPEPPQLTATAMHKKAGRATPHRKADVMVLTDGWQEGPKKAVEYKWADSLGMADRSDALLRCRPVGCTTRQQAATV